MFYFLKTSTTFLNCINCDFNYLLNKHIASEATLLERRARGDLIETYKILNGFVNYGHSMFRSSRSGRHLLHTTSFSINGDIFKRRAIRYWNMLPVDVKETSSINDFKDKLKHYKQDNISRGNINTGYWKLSQEMFRRL